MQELRELQRKRVKEAKEAKQQESKEAANIKVNSSTSHVMESGDVNQPTFSPADKAAASEAGPKEVEAPADLLIQRQSKDETVVQTSSEAVADLSEYQEAAAAAAKPKPPSLLEKFSDIIETLLVPDQPFDLEKFRAKVQADKVMHLNNSSVIDHSILSCPAKPFLERFSVQGEIFNT